MRIKFAVLVVCIFTVFGFIGSAFIVGMTGQEPEMEFARALALLFFVGGPMVLFGFYAGWHNGYRDGLRY